MANRNIIVLGASAGGVEAMTAVVRELPADFSGAVLAVLHVPPFATSELPAILSRAGPLPARHPEDGENLDTGCIYVAPPDRHLLVEKGRMLVKHGPKENRFRPSVDALFRSAAYTYGPRITGVILSGALDDGTSGMWTIKRLGGTAIVQDPEEATFADMPRNVLEHVEVDAVKPAADIAAVLVGMSRQAAGALPDLTGDERERLEMEIAIAARDSAFQRGILELGDRTELTCPDCHGALVRLCEGSLSRFRCHTGHAFTGSALLSGISESTEATLWSTMRALEESTMLLTEFAEHYEKAGQHADAALFRRKAEETSSEARLIHDAALRHQHLSESLRRQVGKRGAR